MKIVGVQKNPAEFQRDEPADRGLARSRGTHDKNNHGRFSLVRKSDEEVRRCAGPAAKSRGERPGEPGRRPCRVRDSRKLRHAAPAKSQHAETSAKLRSWPE